LKKQAEEAANAPAQFNFDTLRTVIRKAIADSAFPSASVGVMLGGRVVFQEAFGKNTYAANAPATPPDAVYDMASLTKVMATTLCIMRLYEDGKIKLDDSVVKYIPEFAVNGKGGVRVRNLLLHNSGLAAFRPYDLRVQGADAAMAALYNEKLVYRTGDSTVYSDLGFITLGEIIHRISGKTLDMFYAETIAKPLGLRSSTFNPDSTLLRRTMPTETDTTWKQAYKRPLVHDPRSALLHGVAGHAGLFSTVQDILTVFKALLHAESNISAFFKPETVQLFTTRPNGESTRALGWDTKDPEKCSCGTEFSPTSFGHTGYTGTSVWCDPVRGLVVVLLTNRVFPTSENNKIRFVRPAVHNAVVRALSN
jgi:serine-type D-Ala-D-Ala carboxypeptidase